MDRDLLNKGDGENSERNPRLGRDRRSAPYERSEEEKFLNGGGRFKRHSEIQNIISLSGDGGDAAGAENPEHDVDRRSGRDRRSGGDRRCGFDTRSEVDKFLQGERRSGVDRRSSGDRRFRSFKKARVFVRSLGLKSESEWCDYVNSGMKPRDIPDAPDNVYANDGWAGWSDWLGIGEAGRQWSHRLRFSMTKRKNAEEQAK
jgi:hypothetical protein